MEEGPEMERRGIAEVGMGEFKSPEQLQAERVPGREFVHRLSAAAVPGVETEGRSESRRRSGGPWERGSRAVDTRSCCLGS